MSKLYLKLQNKPGYGKTFRVAEKIVEPLMPVTNLAPPTFRIRRAVYEHDVGAQSPSDDAILPMPPHNITLSAAAMIDLMEKKLGIRNIVQKALGLLKRAA